MAFIITSIIVFIALILLIKTSIGFPIPNGTITYLYSVHILYSYEPKFDWEWIKKEKK